MFHQEGAVFFFLPRQGPEQHQGNPCSQGFGHGHAASLAEHQVCRLVQRRRRGKRAVHREPRPYPRTLPQGFQPPTQGAVPPGNGHEGQGFQARSTEQTDEPFHGQQSVASPDQDADKLLVLPPLSTTQGLPFRLPRRDGKIRTHGNPRDPDLRLLPGRHAFPQKGHQVRVGHEVCIHGRTKEPPVDRKIRHHDSQPQGRLVLAFIE